MNRRRARTARSPPSLRPDGRGFRPGSSSRRRSSVPSSKRAAATSQSWTFASRITSRRSRTSRAAPRSASDTRSSRSDATVPDWRRSPRVRCRPAASLQSRIADGRAPEAWSWCSSAPRWRDAPTTALCSHDAHYVDDARGPGTILAALAFSGVWLWLGDGERVIGPLVIVIAVMGLWALTWVESSDK